VPEARETWPFKQRGWPRERHSGEAGWHIGLVHKGHVKHPNTVLQEEGSLSKREYRLSD
jgi:hypothetical protein